jgi:uncharacterized membrane protein
MKEKKQVDVETKRANLSFLQLVFPSFLLVLLPRLVPSTIAQLVLGVLIFGYQYYLIQSFVKSMYN